MPLVIKPLVIKNIKTCKNLASYLAREYKILAIFLQDSCNFESNLQDSCKILNLTCKILARVWIHIFSITWLQGTTGGAENER